MSISMFHIRESCQHACPLSCAYLIPFAYAQKHQCMFVHTYTECCSAVFPDVALSEWTEEGIKLCLYLYLGLLPVNHKLIHEYVRLLS